MARNTKLIKVSSEAKAVFSRFKGLKPRKKRCAEWHPELIEELVELHLRVTSSITPALKSGI